MTLARATCRPTKLLTLSVEWDYRHDVAPIEASHSATTRCRFTKRPYDD